MKKVSLGAQTLLYPMPAMLVGANVDGKPNFMTVAWAGIANAEPPMISLAIRHIRYTLKGIRQTLSLSVNVPSYNLVKETDYCGIASGSRANKAKVCRFNIFYGKLTDAPLIEQCPVNLECKVIHILDLGSHSLVIGRIEDIHVSEDCLTDGKPDIQKIKPVVYITGSITGPSGKYYAMGEFIADAFSIGKELKAKE